MDKLPRTWAMCRICGSQSSEEKNIGPIRFWEPDDGWTIAALCKYCYEDFGQAKPKPSDFAYSNTNGVCDDIRTDEDPLIALG
jgi:hypothetical protein